MRFLVLGATGLLGQAVCRQLDKCGHAYTAVSRTSGLKIDLSRPGFEAELSTIPIPNVIINCAASVDLGACELDPGSARAINADLPRELAHLAERWKARLIHVSTDHYWRDHGPRKHIESDPIEILNVYAQTKREGEIGALETSRALVVRTNIVGFRGLPKPTFAEWALGALRSSAEFTAFDDFFTSSLNADVLAEILVELGPDPERRGLVNVASSEVASKAAFIRALAKAFELPTKHMRLGSVSALTSPPRANSLGLDVAKAELWIGRKLPDLEEVARRLRAEHDRRKGDGK